MRRLTIAIVCLATAIAAVGLSTAAATPAAGWRVTTMSQGSGTPNAIACDAKRGCLLVGELSPAALAAGTAQPFIRAVTCGPVDCTGVGARQATILGAWRTSGRRLARMPFHPSVSGKYLGSLSSVTCASASDCLAVGNVDARTHVDCAPNSLNLTVCETLVPVLERWNGSSWTRQMTFPVPVVAQLAVPVGSEQSSSQLDAVSCGGPRACVLVGQVDSSTGTAGPDFADSWNGKNWKMTIMPSPQGTDPQLTSIACSVRSCVAVGSINVNGISEPYAVAEKNGVWGWDDGLPVLQGGAVLNSVSCVPDGACFAVGSRGNGAGSRPFVERWQADRWTAEPVQVPSNSRLRGGAQLVSVSCTAATAGRSARPGTGSCAAVGDYGKQTRRLGLSVGWFVESLGPVLPVQRQASGVARVLGVNVG